MTARKKFLFASVGASLLVALATVAALVGPAKANKTPVTPQQLEAYNQVFMDEVKKGDLLFHGDAATAKQMGVKLTTTAMACAMCHPMASDTHPMSFPKFQVSMNEFATLRDMINWCIEKPNQGEKIDPQSEAMKALEAYIYWSNTGSVLVPGKY
jgi:thiosulfate dehydrogenase